MCDRKCDRSLQLPEELKQTKFQALDGLRGVSILLVIISHFFRSYSLNDHYTGRLGVHIFFVISGFLITTLLFKEKLKYGKLNLKNFYIRRCFRILPVVLLYLTVLIFLKMVYDLKISGTSFLASFLFIKNLPILHHRDWYTEHFWTLGVEEQFYLLFPFLFWLLGVQYYKRLVLFLIVALPMLALICGARLDIRFLHVNLSIHNALGNIVQVFSKGTGSILSGSFFAILFFSQNKLIKIIYEKASYVSSFILFILSFMLCMPAFRLYIPFISEAIFSVLIAIVIILNLKERSFLGQLLNNDLIKKIGILSFSLYVWQQPFTFQQPWSKGNISFWALSLNIVGMFAVAILSYTFYERKFLKYKDLFKKV